MIKSSPNTFGGELINLFFIIFLQFSTQIGAINLKFYPKINKFGRNELKGVLLVPSIINTNTRTNSCVSILN